MFLRPTKPWSRSGAAPRDGSVSTHFRQRDHQKASPARLAGPAPLALFLGGHQGGPEPRPKALSPAARPAKRLGRGRNCKRRRMSAGSFSWGGSSNGRAAAMRCGSVEGPRGSSHGPCKSSWSRGGRNCPGTAAGKERFLSRQDGRRPAPSPRDVLHCHSLWILLPPYKSLLEQQKDNAPDSKYFKNINHRFPLKSVLGAG